MTENQTADYCTNIVSPPSSHSYILAQSDFSGQPITTNPTTTVGNLAIALEKFKLAFKEKRIGVTERDMVEHTSHGSRSKSNKRSDHIFNEVKKNLTHQRSADIWNARLN